MARYAVDTRVPVQQSRSEIENLLTRYSADGFAYGQDSSMAVIQFVMKDRRVKFVLPLPTVADVSRTRRGKARTGRAAANSLAQAQRQRWRALLLCIKAKLESVESGIESFEDAFLAQIVLPDGSTVGERMQDQVRIAYSERKMPPLLGYDGAA